MNNYSGQCHCGHLRVEFSTQWLPEQFQLRECGCSFCRRHGARTTRDPAGTLILKGEPQIYRFGLATADFWLCPTCGVYVAAVLTVPQGRFATLNANTLEIANQLTSNAEVASYLEESQEERIARRMRGWTPTVLQP